eukprot:CAMPEP_0118966168 /NCGR_PEP_ID=MMETSP1173-20130426/3657_1 /TAXON_ID=1034831 /ORGANISM="Rhizochromulina marina cf, Strain CCMP1243" /LENGTH=50 /DNA_ID=CAMNT_0006914903 /DNA_START=153 /DNA_END=305 /DNA_ORIENTATION=+
MNSTTVSQQFVCVLLGSTPLGPAGVHGLATGLSQQRASPVVGAPSWGWPC